MRAASHGAAGEEAARRAVLREVLAAMLGPQAAHKVDCYQLDVQVGGGRGRAWVSLRGPAGRAAGWQLRLGLGCCVTLLGAQLLRPGLPNGGLERRVRWVLSH